MDYDVIEARYVGRFVIWLRFGDNTSGEIDLERELYGPVFEPVRDPTVFKQFEIHPEFHTLTWPNGADFAPEFLHDTVRVTAWAASDPHPFAPSYAIIAAEARDDACGGRTVAAPLFRSHSDANSAP